MVAPVALETWKCAHCSTMIQTTSNRRVCHVCLKSRDEPPALAWPSHEGERSAEEAEQAPEAVQEPRPAERSAEEAAEAEEALVQARDAEEDVDAPGHGVRENEELWLGAAYDEWDSMYAKINNFMFTTPRHIDPKTGGWAGFKQHELSVQQIERYKEESCPPVTDAAIDAWKKKQMEWAREARVPKDMHMRRCEIWLRGQDPTIVLGAGEEWLLIFQASDSSRFNRMQACLKENQRKSRSESEIATTEEYLQKKWAFPNDEIAFKATSRAAYLIAGACRRIVCQRAGEEAKVAAARAASIMAGAQARIAAACRRTLRQRAYVESQKTVDGSQKDRGTCNICLKDDIKLWYRECGHPSCKDCCKRWVKCPTKCSNKTIKIRTARRMEERGMHMW